MIGSNRTTNEENYVLQKFARTILGTSNIDHERTTGYAAFARALSGHPRKTASLRDIASACAILVVGGNPTDEHPLLAWLLRTAVRLNRARLYIANHTTIKLERQARAVQGLPPNGYKDLTTIFDRGETDLAKAIKDEPSLIVIFGSEIRGAAIDNLVAWGLERGPNPDSVRFACLGDHSNSRGAADMGLFPDLLPGYIPMSAPGAFAEYANLPSTPGKTIPQMLDAAAAGDLGALLVVGANPASRAKLNPAALKNTFLVVQDLFLTETVALADVVLPAASLYEKSGTVTNTFGDIQIVRKAADRPGVKPDLEILVRLAEAMGAPIKSLVPFGRGGTTADLGQSRGAQAGEADRHAVWLEANGLEPRTSAPLIPSPFSTKSAASSPAISSIASIFLPATTYTPNRLRRGSSLPLRSGAPISSCRLTIRSLLPERWAVIARRSSNLKNTRQRNSHNPQPTDRLCAAAAGLLTCSLAV